MCGRSQIPDVWIASQNGVNRIPIRAYLKGDTNAVSRGLSRRQERRRERIAGGDTLMKTRSKNFMCAESGIEQKRIWNVEGEWGKGAGERERGGKGMREGERKVGLWNRGTTPPWPLEPRQE